MNNTRNTCTTTCTQCNEVGMIHLDTNKIDLDMT